jgi:gamma-tubulin complex component 5
LESLEFLKPSEEHVEPSYTWEELAAEDPLLRDKSVWKNIDYGADSSDDEATSQDSIDFSGLTESTAGSSINDEGCTRTEDFFVHVNPQSLRRLQSGQFWRLGEVARETPVGGSWLDPKVQHITELQAIREVLFMLSGLPTTLFQGGDTGSVTVVRTFGLKHVSNHVFHGLLEDLSKQGTDILFLRKWSNSKHNNSLIQKFQEATSARLRQFDRKLSELQSTLVAPNRATTVSIVEIRQELQFLTNPILSLCSLVGTLIAEPYAHAFRCLELLYEETCSAHMSGDNALYQFLGELFFDCFQVYLRPIKKWMVEGELLKDDRTFFVSEADGGNDLALWWQDRYKLRNTSDEVLHAPKFLHNMAARKIFTTGKSIVILRQLGKYNDLKNSQPTVEPKLEFHNVCDISALSLIPFPDLFDVAFERWIQSKHHAASMTLRHTLLEECGLRKALNANANIYFMRDGATTGVFANSIFDKLDKAVSGWHDRFNTTELAQSTMGTLDAVTADKLRVSFSSKKYSDVQRARKSVRSLECLTVTYSLPWPVQIVITKETIRSYHRIFAFLLQIRRAVHSIEKTRLLRDTANVDSGTDECALFYSVRSRLLWFTSTLYSHLTDLVITTGTMQMHQDLIEAEDVDQMIRVHGTYIENLVDRALLGTKVVPIHKAIITILDLAIKLSDARTAHDVAQSSYRASMSSLREQSLLQRIARRVDPEFSEEDGGASDVDITTLSADSTEMSYIEQLRKVKTDFDRLCRFVSTGLRSVARAGDPGSWDMLAEKLEDGMDRC